MPDANRPPAPSPGSWADAFAALPQEVPPASRWAAVSARLEAHRPGRMLPGWLGVAAAAAVVLAVVVPREAREPEPAHVAIPVADTSVASRPIAGTPLRSTPAAEATAPAATEVATREPVARQEPDRVASTTTASATAETSAVPQPLEASEPDMARLYRESAQLEALLAATRDQRMGSAGAMVLADALDAQVAGIDAALSAPALAPARRELLWQSRVELLRQAVGFESTRMLVASRADPAMLLVRVD